MLELLDYRRRVSDLYSWLRLMHTKGEYSPEEIWRQYRTKRELLLSTHSQSALTPEQKEQFSKLPYFDYDPTLRFTVRVDREVERETIEVPLQVDGVFSMERFGKVTFLIHGENQSLFLYWVLGYGGGVFLPFRDATNQMGETYGGGRYLLDTIKSADLGMESDQLILDFNYAYNPSCVYDSRWHCPLAPPENWLSVPIKAGEKDYPRPSN